MKKRQVNSQKMYQSILNLMTNFNASWSTNPALSEMVATLTNLFGLLGIAATAQKNATKGITQSKAQNRQALIRMAMAHSAAGVSYGADSGNITLKGNSKLIESSLERANDVDFIDTCQSLYNLLNPLATNLTNYGANAATLGAFNTAILNYHPVSQLPANARAAKKTATGNVKDQITAIDTLLKDKLDPIMVQFKTTTSDFYNDYMNLRHSAHASANLKTVSIVLHAKTVAGLPLENVEFILTSTLGAKRNKFSKADGSIHYTRLKPAIFTITAILPGYANQTQTITANNPQKLNLNFIMIVAGGGIPATGTTPVTA